MLYNVLQDKFGLPRAQGSGAVGFSNGFFCSVIPASSGGRQCQNNVSGIHVFKTVNTYFKDTNKGSTVLDIFCRQLVRPVFTLYDGLLWSAWVKNSPWPSAWLNIFSSKQVFWYVVTRRVCVKLFPETSVASLVWGLLYYIWLPFSSLPGIFSLSSLQPLLFLSLPVV